MADDAVCAGEVARAAGGIVNASYPRPTGQAAQVPGDMMRGLLAEFGIDIPEGLERALLMARQVVDGEAVPDVPTVGGKMVGMLSQQALATHLHLREIDRSLATLQRSDDVAKRLATIPGSGLVGATALAASVTDPGQFRSGRQFAAWLGLTPKPQSVDP